jgi:predicted permease
LRTVAQQVVGNLGRTFWTLAGAVAAVLLIACASIANLFLARVSARTKEIAVRLSLGARRGGIVRQFLAESLLFTTVAGLLGLFLAWWSLRGIQILAGPQLPRADEIALDPAVVAFALGVALLAGLLIGLYPAIQASRTDVQVVLRETGRGAGGGRAAKSFRHALVVTQVAFSLTLLICAGLLVSSFARLLQADPGFRSAGRAFGGLSLPNARYGEPERAREFARQLQQKLAEDPELARGAAVFGLPLTGTLSITPYSVQGRPIVAVQERPLVSLSFATPDYFATLGIRLEAGRFFTADDRFEGEKVVIVNASLAHKLFPGGSALDQVILTGRDANVKNRIVGVIADVRVNGLTSPAPDQLYFPTAQRSANFLHVVAEARDGRPAATVIPVLQRILRELDPSLALAQPQTLDEALAQSFGVQRAAMALLLAFAGIAAFLAAVGIYSVMAYAVTQRTGEIGVRLALGATTGDILRLVLRAGAVQVGTGLLLGLLGAFAGSQLLQDLLYQARPFDFTVFGGVALAFSAVAAAACLLPARRATHIDPMIALRAE